MTSGQESLKSQFTRLKLTVAFNFQLVLSYMELMESMELTGLMVLIALGALDAALSMEGMEATEVMEVEREGHADPKL